LNQPAVETPPVHLPAICRRQTPVDQAEFLAALMIPKEQRMANFS
jgi:hypothetical protein